VLSRSSVVRLAISVTAVSAVLAAYAQPGPGAAQHYMCVAQQNCGTTSRYCWCPKHPWGSTFCTFCDGNAVQDLCRKSDGGTCTFLGQNQGCGAKFAGECACPLLDNGGTIGLCAGSTPLADTCSVPMC
jgi:hypothetical protein